MIPLGEFLVEDEVTFNESRRKVLRLAQALGFDEIGATRLAMAYSELCRLGVDRPGGVRTHLGLEEQPGGLALGVDFAFSANTGAPLVADAFFRSFTAIPGAAWSYRGLLPLPDHCFRLDEELLESLRSRLAHPSREELLRDLRNKNAALEQEITKRMQSEEEIKRQRTLLDTLVNSLPQLIYSKDTSGTYQIVNNALCEMLGLPVWEVLGKNASELFRPETAERINRADHRTFTEKHLTTEVDWRTYPDGRKAIFDIIRVPVLDEQGEATGLVGAFTDITERMRMEEAVRESEVKYRELVENANSIILKLDMDGRITFFNEFAQKFFGFTPEEILGQSIVGTIVPESESTGRDLAAFIQDLVRNPGQHARNENENVTKDGERVWVGWTNQALRDDATGQGLGVLCVGSDVTAQKIAQLQRDEALELISGSIRYASRIQQAVLPAPEFLAALFAEHFVLWQPRDVVGGDIFWSVPWGQGGLFVLGDCTGHSVPGAFMTLITTGALAKALRDVEPGDVAGLVSHTHQLVQTGLGQHVDTGGSDDGMELGVCYIPQDRANLRFCGARFSLFLLENGEVAEHKGDRRGIGYRGISLDFPFTAQDFALAPGQRFFLTSDGLLDQIGGERRRSYGKKRFMELLVGLCGQPLATHPERIMESLRAYQGQEKRRDDVSVAGFRVV